MSHHLANLCHLFNSIEASNIVIFYPYIIIWGSDWRTRIVSNRWNSREVYRTATSIAWTGREEANDLDNYVMDRTGSEVKGQA